jgi:hypothetical protein
LRGKSKFSEPRAQELRARYGATFGAADLLLPVEALAENLLGHVSEVELDATSDSRRRRHE